MSMHCLLYIYNHAVCTVQDYVTRQLVYIIRYFLIIVSITYFMNGVGGLAKLLYALSVVLGVLG